MTIQYSIEIRGGEVRITQAIDQKPATIGPPFAEQKPRPDVPAQASASPDDRSFNLPATADGESPPPIAQSGSGGNQEKPGTGGGGPFNGFTVVLGPVVLPSSCPHCNPQPTVKE
jgi:hypothetical protein